MAADAIIHINGWPGCCKLTIARELAAGDAAAILAARCRAALESHHQPSGPTP